MAWACNGQPFCNGNASTVANDASSLVSSSRKSTVDASLYVVIERYNKLIVVMCKFYIRGPTYVLREDEQQPPISDTSNASHFESVDDLSDILTQIYHTIIVGGRMFILSTKAITFISHPSTSFTYTIRTPPSSLLRLYVACMP